MPGDAARRIQFAQTKVRSGCSQWAGTEIDAARETEADEEIARSVGGKCRARKRAADGNFPSKCTGGIVFDDMMVCQVNGMEFPSQSQRDRVDQIAWSGNVEFYRTRRRVSDQDGLADIVLNAVTHIERMAEVVDSADGRLDDCPVLTCIVFPSTSYGSRQIRIDGKGRGTSRPP